MFPMQSEKVSKPYYQRDIHLDEKPNNTITMPNLGIEPRTLVLSSLASD